MMGFGETGPIVWLLGALAMIIIWGGVWWGLSALVFHWPAHVRNPSVKSSPPSIQPDTRGWQQPTFDPPDRNPETGLQGPQGSPVPQPPQILQRRAHTKGDYR
jgi:hypothetical protein